MALELNLSNIYTDLKHKAALANTSLSQICEDAGVNRSTVEQWKETPPRLFGIIVKLDAAVKAAQAKAAGTETPAA